MTLAPKLFASLLLVISYFLVRRNEPRSCWLQKAMINQTMLRSCVHRYVMNYNGDSNNRRFDALDRPSAKNLNQSFCLIKNYATFLKQYIGNVLVLCSLQLAPTE